MPDQLLDCAACVLGPVDLVQDCGWGEGRPVVLRVRDRSGVAWFLKRHRDRARYLAELTAYRWWAPALGEAVPRLRASCDRHHVLILSALAGGPAPWPGECELQRQAGRRLRQLHDAQPARPSPGLAALKLRDFDQLRPAAAQLLGAPELAAARAQIAALADLPAPVLVPCHHDYTPRNWLVGDDGAIGLIDFEWSGLDAWVADLARLHLDAWVGRVHLRRAFLAGYGRELTRADQAALHSCAVLTGVWLVVKASETNRPSFTAGTRAALLRILRCPR